MDTEQVRVDAQEVKGLLEIGAEAAGTAAQRRRSRDGLGSGPTGPKEAKALIDQYKTPVWIYATSPME